jgi:ribonucleoside-diphosphate reductase alpha chain
MSGFDRTGPNKKLTLTPKPVLDVSATLLDGGEAPKQSGPQMNTHQAKTIGYTGNPCPICGSMRMIHTGHCDTCQECFQTTGCS